MRIAFVGPVYPFRGGIAQFASIWGRKLVDKRHSVKVFTFVSQFPSLLFPGKDQMDHSQNPIRLDRQRVLTAYNPLTWLPAYRAIVQWKPDTVLFHYWIPFFAPVYGVLIRLLTRCGIRCGIVLHNASAHEKWPLATRMTRFMLSGAKYLVTLSETVTSEVNELLKGRQRPAVYQLHHPVYDYYTELGSGSDKVFETGDGGPVILFFGYIKPYKGLDLLLSAMPAILAGLPGLRLLVVGEVYGDSAPYTRQIHALGIEKQVVFIDRFVSNEEVPAFFRASDLVILPYRTASQSGIAQLAYAFDKPVLATAVGGLTEVVKDGINGIVVPPDDPMAMAGGVLRFFAEKPDFSEGIRREKEKVSWEPLVDLFGRLP